MRTKENDFLSKYYTNQSIRKKIDSKLSRIASLNAGLGIDSSDAERKSVKRAINSLEKEIKELDPDFYNTTIKIEKD